MKHTSSVGPSEGTASFRSKVTTHRKTSLLQRFVQSCCPDTFRMLRLLHVDHVLRLDGSVQVVLFLSCLISAGFAYFWITDIYHFTCFKSTPWNQDGLSRFTCTYQATGSILFIFMFKHAAVALVNYDDEHEELRRKKRLTLLDLRQQCTDVLIRAQKRSTELCGLLSAELGRSINGHVKFMRQILQTFKQSFVHADEEVYGEFYDKLLVAMAEHLHDVRQPALDHFTRLLEISGDQFLIHALEKERRESMVQMLAGTRDGLPRAGTVFEEPAHLRYGTVFWSGTSKWFSHFTHPSVVVKARSSGFLNHFQVSDAFKSKFSTFENGEWKLKDIPEIEKKENPEHVVLRPVNLVLRWFSEFKQKNAAEVQEHEKENRAAEGRSVAGQTTLSGRFVRMKNNILSSDQGWYMTIGNFFCFLYLLFYLISLRKVLLYLEEGKCAGEEFACTGAAIRKSLGACAMGCCIISMIIVVFHIDRVDNVMEAHREIQQLEDFKHEIDKLNAHAFTSTNDDAKSSNGTERISMMKDICDELDKKKEIIDEIAREGFGGGLPFQRYEDLLAMLTGESKTPQAQVPHGDESKPLMEHMEAPPV